LLCDDNKNELADISAHLKKYFNNTSSHNTEWDEQSLLCFDNPHNALDFYKCGNKIDIAVLDIIMPGMTGIELAEKFRQSGYKGYIIFLTTINNYAAQSYSVQAFDYMLKPVSAPAVENLIDKLIENERNGDNENFTVKIKTEMRRIKYKELMYAEVINHNLYFYLDRDKIITAYASLKEYADTLLRDKRMIKVNKSFIINIDYISSFKNQEVIMQNGTIISVTGSFKEFKNICYGRMFGKSGREGGTI
jgi:DNA-binding LytR/AlgR family response regulator